MSWIFEILMCEINFHPCFRHLPLPLLHRWSRPIRFSALHISGMYSWTNNSRVIPFAGNVDCEIANNRPNRKCKSLHLLQRMLSQITNKIVLQSDLGYKDIIPLWMSWIAVNCTTSLECGNVACAFGTQLWFALLSVGYKAEPSLFKNCSPVTENATIIWNSPFFFEKI